MRFPTDMAGTVLSPGQKIVYPTRQGSSTDLNLASITKIKYEEGIVEARLILSSSGKQSGKLVRLTRFDRALVL